MTPKISNTLSRWAAVLCVSAASLWAESRFAAPVENYRRTHDVDAFAKEKRRALEQPTADLTEDITYLIAVCADAKDEFLQNQALEELYFIAYQISNTTAKPVDSFKPAIPVFEQHLDEALATVNSKWTGMIISLTALAGLQPTAKEVPLFYRALEAKDTRMTELVLIGLARLNPRPADAKKILLQRAPKFDRDERIEILAFALDDPDLMAIFAKSLESTDRYEQWRATKLLVHVGEAAKPVLEILRRLEQRPDLDKEVAANITLAIDQIERKR